MLNAKIPSETDLSVVGTSGIECLPSLLVRQSFLDCLLDSTNPNQLDTEHDTTALSRTFRAYRDTVHTGRSLRAELPAAIQVAAGTHSEKHDAQGRVAQTTPEP